MKPSRANPLSATRAGVASFYCAALALPATLFEHPLVLGAALAAVVGAALATGMAAQLRTAARLGVPLALLVVAINPLVSAGGETVLVRGWTLLGRPLDVTLEALAYGGVAALRVLVLVLTGALFSAVVDPDELLALLRRVSPRSALTAALTARLAPVLVRDAGRIADAARCRPQPPGRAAIARATLRGTLDRAVDVAAALEVSGYGAGPGPARARRRWSRHDTRITAAASILAAVAIGAKVAGVAGLVAYPRLAAAVGAPELALAGVILVCALAPLAVPTARLGVARG